MSFFDQPARVTRFKLVHAVWRRQRMEVLAGVAPVSLLLARTEDTVVGLTDVRGYPDGFVFLLRVRWDHVADPYAEVPWPFPGWGSPDPLDGEPFPDELLRFGVRGRPPGSGRDLGPVAGRAALAAAGPLAFVCAWPERGIPETRVEIDAGLVLDAAAAAVPFFPEVPS